MTDCSISTYDEWKRYGKSTRAAKSVALGRSVYRGADSYLTPVGCKFINSERAETVSEKFQRLSKQWIAETQSSSSLDEVTTHRAYRQIINMGKSVVSFILKDLETEPKPWFVALRKITGADPIPPQSAGNLRKMTAVWLEWGRLHKYI